MHFRILSLALLRAGTTIADDTSPPGQNQVKICSLADLGGTCYVETPPIKSIPVCIPIRMDIKVKSGNLLTGSFGVGLGLACQLWSHADCSGEEAVQDVTWLEPPGKMRQNDANHQAGWKSYACKGPMNPADYAKLP